MKFTWDVRETKYKDMDIKEITNLANSGQYSLQEMQDAWDEYGDRWKWTRIWEVFNLFEAEKGTIKLKSEHPRWDGSIDYNTNSLKAWCKRNNVPVDVYGTCGLYSYSWHGSVKAINTTKERIEKDIPLVFAKLIEVLRDKEKTYFLEHDEYSIKLTKINENLNNNLPMPLKKGISYYSHPFRGIIVRHDENNDTERKLTMEELDKIIIFQNEVAIAIKNVIDTKSPQIEV